MGALIESPPKTILKTILPFPRLASLPLAGTPNCISRRGKCTLTGVKRSDSPGRMQRRRYIGHKQNLILELAKDSLLVVLLSCSVLLGDQVGISFCVLYHSYQQAIFGQLQDLIPCVWEHTMSDLLWAE